MNPQNSFLQNIIVPFLLCMLLFTSYLIFKYNPEIMNQDSYLSVLTKSSDLIDKWVYKESVEPAGPPAEGSGTGSSSAVDRVNHNFVESVSPSFNPPPISSGKFTWQVANGQISMRDNSALHVYQTTGEHMWTFQLPKDQDFSPGSIAFTKGFYILTTLSGQIYGFDPKHGQIHWYRASSHKYFLAPKVVGDNLITFIEEKNGKTWGMEILSPLNGEVLSSIAGLEMPLAADPVIYDELVYFATQSGRLSAVALETGKPIWTTEGSSSFRNSPLMSGERIYVVNEDGLVLGFDRKSGKKVSELDLEASIESSFAHASGAPYVALADSQGALLAIDLKAAKRMWRYQLNMVPPDSAIRLIKLNPSSWSRLGVASAMGGWTVWTYCNASRLCLYDLKTGQLLHRIELKGKPLGTFQFSASPTQLFAPVERAGKRLLSGFEYPESSVDKSSPAQ